MRLRTQRTSTVRTCHFLLSFNVLTPIIITVAQWKVKGVHLRCLVNLLLEVDDGKYLDSASRQQVIEDAGHFARVRIIVVYDRIRLLTDSDRLFGHLTNLLASCRKSYPKYLLCFRSMIRTHLLALQTHFGTSIAHQ